MLDDFILNVIEAFLTGVMGHILEIITIELRPIYNRDTKELLVVALFDIERVNIFSPNFSQ